MISYRLSLKASKSAKYWLRSAKSTNSLEVVSEAGRAKRLSWKNHELKAIKPKNIPPILRFTKSELNSVKRLQLAISPKLRDEFFDAIVLRVVGNRIKRQKKLSYWGNHCFDCVSLSKMQLLCLKDEFLLHFPPKQ